MKLHLANTTKKILNCTRCIFFLMEKWINFPILDQTIFIGPNSIETMLLCKDHKYFYFLVYIIFQNFYFNTINAPSSFLHFLKCKYINFLDFIKQLKTDFLVKIPL